MNRFPGVGRRIRQRLKATGYWKDGRPDIARFCTDKDYRSQYLYAWLGDRVPGPDAPRDLRLGRRTAAASPRETALSLERGARTAAASGGVASVEFQLGAHSYETRFLPLGDRPSTPRRLLMIVREITERTRAEEAARALARVSHELAGTLDPAEATERVVSAVLDLSRVRRASLFQLDPASGALVCVAEAGQGEHEHWLGQVIPPGDGMTQQAIRERRPLWTHDVGAGVERLLDVPAHLRERVAAEGHRSVVVLPLVSRGEVLGALALASDAGYVFRPVELGLLSGFADAAAVAIRNARVYELSERRRQAAEALADVRRP